MAHRQTDLINREESLIIAFYFYIKPLQLHHIQFYFDLQLWLLLFHSENALDNSIVLIPFERTTSFFHLSPIKSTQHVEILIAWYCLTEKYLLYMLIWYWNRTSKSRSIWFERFKTEQKIVRLWPISQTYHLNNSNNKWRQNVTPNMGWKASVRMEKVLAK